MKLWNLFSAFASTDMGEVINKTNDSMFLRSDGTVYRQEGNLITGSDGAVLNVVDTGSDTSSGIPGLAVATDSGFGKDDDW